jgi:hypothetical protein
MTSTAKVNEMTEDFMKSCMTSHRIDWVEPVDFMPKRK